VPVFYTFFDDVRETFGAAVKRIVLGRKAKSERAKAAWARPPPRLVNPPRA